jgi:endonuclease YncB( thermonuclease family)
MSRTTIAALVLQLATAVATPALPADVPAPLESPNAHWRQSTAVGMAGVAITISGRAAVLDGHTLWFPQHATKVQLADVDSCELPQWSYDPQRHGESSIPKPVPCGPLAKAWLRRIVGSKRITCNVTMSTEPRVFIGICTAGGRDLALEMLRVGWARVQSPSRPRSDYLAWQRYAMSARYGMWATYVLDMDEWRRKAVDKTTSRRPIADFNLLAERETEISPPFEDARRQQRRTDR